MNKDIQLGVSLYSFSGEYITGVKDLEQCIKSVAEMGYKGIEIVAAQMVPEYPYPSDEWLYKFRDLLEKYELTPACWSAYIDNGLRSDRDLSHDEIVQFTYNDLVYAKKAGFNQVRTQHSISPEIYEEMVPYCEKLGVDLTIEMHHPHHPHVPVWEEYVELMSKYPCLGAVPDLSIFQRRPHRLILEGLIKEGFREDKLMAVFEAHGEGMPLEDALKAFELNDKEKEYTEMMYEKFTPTPVSDLEILIPVTKYIHGKFYILDGDERDFECIPYDEILPLIKKLGYKGFIAAEYEGHHFDLNVDMREQLNRYTDIFNRFINND